jgi:ribosomal protein S18 acetylase RimI-like enzyme
VAKLTFRKATAGDTERIAEIMHSEPGPNAVGICGSVERARAMGYAQVRVEGGPNGWQSTVVGELDGEVVVILQAGSQPSGLQVPPALALQALRIFGPIGVLRLLSRVRTEMKVSPGAPDGAYHIAELHAHPRHRNRGLGGAALDFAEEAARRLGHRQMSLVTDSTNPARRLYERHGFRVVETRSDPAYERITGIAGRHLMVKELT